MRIAIGRETNRSEVPPGPLLSVSKRVSNGHVLGSHRDRPIGLGVARYERSSGGCSAITIGVGVKPYWGLGAWVSTSRSAMCAIRGYTSS